MNESYESTRSSLGFSIVIVPLSESLDGCFAERNGYEFISGKHLNLDPGPDLPTLRSSSSAAATVLL